MADAEAKKTEAARAKKEAAQRRKEEQALQRGERARAREEIARRQQEAKSKAKLDAKTRGVYASLKVPPGSTALQIAQKHRRAACVQLLSQAIAS